MNFLKTPNIDNFVNKEAVSFINAFSQNTVCTPSRCSYMTGWYPHVRGHRTMYHMLHPERDEPNLLKILKENGYYVWWGGKNDLTPGQDSLEKYCDVKFYPSEKDYNHWGLTPREGTHDGDMLWRGNEDGDNFYSFMKGKLNKDKEKIYCDRDWANILGAIDKILSYKNNNPLCIYLPLSYPHPPYSVEEPCTVLLIEKKFLNEHSIQKIGMENHLSLKVYGKIRSYTTGMKINGQN